MVKALHVAALVVMFASQLRADEGSTTLPTFPWKEPEKGGVPYIDQLVAGTRFAVDWDPQGPGGSVTAKGKYVWNSRLKALGVGAHSAYRNRIAMEADEKFVVLYGNEGPGKYVEIMDAQTGDTLMVTQLWATRKRQTGKSSPAPAQAPEDKWEWKENFVDAALTVGNIKYVPELSTGSSSPRHFVSAIDLTTGQALWRERLRGFCSPGESDRETKLNLRMVDGRLLVYGMERRGWFIESVNLADGLSKSVIQYWRRPAARVQSPEREK